MNNINNAIQRKLDATINKVKANNNLLPPPVAKAPTPAKKTVLKGNADAEFATAVGKAVSEGKVDASNAVAMFGRFKSNSILTAKDEELPIYTGVPSEDHLDDDLAAELDSDADSEDYQSEEEDKENNIEDNTTDGITPEIDDAKAAQMVQDQERRIAERRNRNPPDKFLEGLMAKYCSWEELEGQGFERKIPERYRLSAEERKKAKDDEERAKKEEEERAKKEEEQQDEDEEESESSEEDDEEETPSKPVTTGKTVFAETAKSIPAPLIAKTVISRAPAKVISQPVSLPAKVICTTTPLAAKASVAIAKVVSGKSIETPIAAKVISAPKATAAVPMFIAKPEEKIADDAPRRSTRPNRFQGKWKDDDDLPSTSSDDEDFDGESAEEESSSSSEHESVDTSPSSNTKKVVAKVITAPKRSLESEIMTGEFAKKLKVTKP